MRIAEPPFFNHSRRHVRRLWFFQSVSGGKTKPAVRIAPGKSKDFQQSAAFFLIHENPQVFMESVKIYFDTQNPALLRQDIIYWAVLASVEAISPTVVSSVVVSAGISVAEAGGWVAMGMDVAAGASVAVVVVVVLVEQAVMHAAIISIASAIASVFFMKKVPPE